MPSYIARIEIYPGDNLLEGWSFGCPDLNLMGYTDILELLRDIRLEAMRKI